MLETGESGKTSTILGLSFIYTSVFYRTFFTWQRDISTVQKWSKRVYRCHSYHIVSFGDVERCSLVRVIYFTKNFLIEFDGAIEVAKRMRPNTDNETNFLEDRPRVTRVGIVSKKLDWFNAQWKRWNVCLIKTRFEHKRKNCL